MSVAAQLELDDPARGLLARARTCWPVWWGRDPRLAVVGDLLDLPRWIGSVDRDDADDVLHELARLGSPTGGDDVAAAGALAWLLLPGASQVARRLGDMTPRIDECVAAQLWIEVRTFDWQRRRKVAGNIVRNLRRGVLRELGVGQHLRTTDCAWARAVPLEPEAQLWEILDAKAAGPLAVDPEEELADLLSWATSLHVIDDQDKDLLVGLAEAACATKVTRSREGRGGLCSRAGSSVVAARHGVSEATVRRRARRSIQALADAYARQLSA
ncbi:hypothetical protein [Cellulomonas sp. C5510]|uniref:hypothetical protein n=1 Tax=Cellulomonas sp. C5510 TaxID=2871170 RepID=UPI001C942A00|nr:hypothetical protein [Cellulomonas sp. C5510]QZN87063.1 hypothetical protein K5O09_08160 [Cellulomonas sp. C5510]